MRVVMRRGWRKVSHPLIGGKECADKSRGIDCEVEVEEETFFYFIFRREAGL